MRKNIKIKKTLALLAVAGFGVVGLTACGNDPSLPAVEGDFGKAPKIAAGEKGKEPKELKKAVLVEGSGKTCGADAILKVNYTGQLWNGKVFDSSFENKNATLGQAAPKPAIFPLKGVIKGWQDGLKDVKTGSRIELVIPPSLGYGKQEAGEIPENSTLVFVVDMLDCFGSEQAKAGLADLKKAKPTGKTLSGLKIEGQLGDKPKITIADKAQLPKEKTSLLLSEGSGKAIKKGDTAIYHIVYTSSKDGFKTRSSWEAGKDKFVHQETPSELVGKKVGSRVLLYIPANGDQPDAILTIDLLGVIPGGEK